MNIWVSHSLQKFEIFFSTTAILLTVALYFDQTIWSKLVWALMFLAISATTLTVMSLPNWQTRIVKLHRSHMLFLISLIAALPRITESWEGIWVWVTFLGLLGVREGMRIVIELSSVILLRIEGLEGINYPGISEGYIRYFYVSLATATALFAGTVLFSFPFWVSLFSVILVSPFVCIILFETVKYLMPGRTMQRSIVKALETFQPIFVLYWSAPKNSKYQVSMWIPYLKRLNLPFILVVRNAESFDDAVEAASGVPVILARSNRILEKSLVSSIKAVFYVNNSDKNSQAVRFTRLTHIQLLHGDSEKASSYNPVVNMFDRIYVAGQAAIDRYANHGVSVDSDKFRIVGRPQVESVRQDATPFTTKIQPTILYAPTWAGFFGDSSYSSLTEIMPLIENILGRGCSIIFRPHPFTHRSPELAQAAERVRKRLAQDMQETGRHHIFGHEAEQNMQLTDCFNASDAMIADISSVVSDYLYSGKPLALIPGHSSPVELLQELPIAEGCYLLNLGTNPWKFELDRMFHHDPLEQIRHKMRLHYLGNINPDSYVDSFLNTARQDVLA